MGRSYSPSSCIVQNGEAPAGTAQQPQVSGRCWGGRPRPLRANLSLPAALLTHTWLCPRLGLAPPTPLCCRNSLQQTSGWERLGNREPCPEIKQSGKALPAGISSPHSHPLLPAGATCHSSAAENRAELALPAGICVALDLLPVPTMPQHARCVLPLPRGPRRRKAQRPL